METKSAIVFVTGASGYVGFEIVHQLLEAGYLVRGSARGSKFEGLKKALTRFPNFEAVEIQNVSTADFSDVFKGVEAVIHTAAPVPTRLDKTNTTMKSVVDGYLNVVRQAHKAGVKKLVVTSSITAYPIGGPFGVDDWNSVTEEQAASGNPWFLYGAQKKFGDQAVIEYAKSHPEIDVTIFSPTWIFGPLRPGFHHILTHRDPDGSDKSLTSVAYIYKLLNPANTEFVDPIVVDVRDVAKLHVLAASSTSNVVSSDSSRTESAEKKTKRFAVLAPYLASYKEAVQYIAEAFPELKAQGRLVDSEKAPGYPKELEGKIAGIDWERIRVSLVVENTVVAVSEEGDEDSEGKRFFRTWKETVVDTVRSLLELEKAWETSSEAK
ncbi:NAD(P)-binding protein [Dendrothele bispora CBS 962.96]|uniref:NAD(P)-binding protein n=1 Tax=Dendrothele bispora (strain CBS 962.96) TaxID=1314807 RepID=A0A4S8LA18_DENBC|nr:NAD(P)-binding protein [Dendrothele bispora CBS 962.96]